MHDLFRTRLTAVLLSTVLLTAAISWATEQKPDGELPSKTLTRGLVAHWKFDENDGTKVIDTTASLNVGVIEGGTTRIDGPLHRALRFDGKTGRVPFGSPKALDLPTEMSAFAWIRFENVTTGGLGQCVYGQTTPKGNGGQYELCVGRGKNVHEVTVLWKDVDVCVSNSKLKPDQWYHVGFTRTGKKGNWTCTIYVDGVVSSIARNIETEVGPALPFAIGRPGAYDGIYFQGAVDDLRIYDRAITAAEVDALFKTR